ncbi:head-tail adaptor protein [Mangrovicoccus algicola]|uniref:Head-tail adaptor protein n=1 Tax=Mangrovicoccus algicola TaxID=2771008 RepID=A0A8J6YUZ0_9RHOB|nr:head-tail adaptor protein [Mangrovicoccus algicola]MBE3639738.1 head-tail adaptor protein [Mangrovicoccus algicola]
MTPSQLSRLLVLEAVRRVEDGAGGYAETWEALGRHWARLRPARGRDRARDALALSGVPTEIVLRGAPAGAAARPVAGQRFRDGTRAWRIVAVTEADAAGRYLRCDAIEETVP